MVDERKGMVGVTTWIIRVLIGIVFLFSGFVKAVDPWGFLYKTEEYLSVLSISVWPNLLLVGVFALCAVEFIAGIFLLLGCFRKSVAILVFLLLCFMLPLTAWIAISDPVKDCGCFGDAFKISNWASLWKNVVMMIGAIWLFRHNQSSHWLVTPALQWLVLLTSGVYVITIELFGYTSQPLLDFRPYKVGSKLIEESSIDDGTTHFAFVYEKDGEKKIFREDDELPSEDDGWVFVYRIEMNVDDSSINQHEKDHNFRIWSENGNEDLTEEVISESGKEIIVMMPDMGEVSPAISWKINSLYEWAENHEVKMIGVVAGSQNEIERWKDLSMASYPIYSADDTQIKEVVRGNPGIVYLEEGIVGWKSTLNALNIDDFMSPEISDDAKNFSLDHARVLRNTTSIYITVLIALVVMSFLPKLRKLYFKPAPLSHDVTHDDKAPL